MLLVAVTGALVLQLAGVYLPSLQNLLGRQALSLVEIAICCALSTLGYAAIRLDRLVHPSKRLAGPARPDVAGTG